ncbi:phage major tail protein%2C phi13 family [uncultured Dorea sp.]|jgi:phi13 family phage major tail protein|uniref:major tail protein n=1 Tax=Dorea formicigenerans TaxID=39486 RepID=UPI000820753A|nr:major tail protein [uncultured Dorea sp.]SCH77716.1 phage major tail protein%2C phi13 family [uncultured Dorea sp.]
MAYVGLRKPIIGEVKEGGGYNEPFACGKAIGINVTPNYAEGGLNADDVQSEYDKQFNYADVTLNTSTLPIEAHKKMFGHTVDEAKKNVKFNANDQANYVGMGWISAEVVDGARSYIGNFLKKVKFSEPSEEYSTKGDSIEYKTPSISGRALAMDNGDWKETEMCSTEADALKWIYTQFGSSQATQSIETQGKAVK